MCELSVAMWAYRVEWLEYRGRWPNGLSKVFPKRYYARTWESARLRLEVVQGRVGAFDGTIIGTWQPDPAGRMSEELLGLAALLGA